MSSPVLPNSDVNVAAFFTVTGLGIATIASCLGAAAATSTISTVAFAALGIGFAGASIGAVIAWAEDNSTVGEYLGKAANNTSAAVAGLIQLVAQVAFQAIVEGMARGIVIAFSRKIGGADHTIQYSRA